MRPGQPVAGHTKVRPSRRPVARVVSTVACYDAGPMTSVPDWRGRDIAIAPQQGGVLAVADPWDNLIRTGASSWTAPELIQS